MLEPHETPNVALCAINLQSMKLACVDMNDHRLNKRLQLYQLIYINWY